MCICFVFLDDNTADSGYQLILINNRDEYYQRPTKPAALWKDSCISGLDQEAGKENGTWLGLNTSGKIGILLNILQPTCDVTKKGRGYMVTDFISGQEDIDQYAQRIAEQKHEYNEFNLVLLQKKDNKWNVSMISTEDDDMSPMSLKENILAFGNSPYDKPWKKVSDGKMRFRDIISKYNNMNDKLKLKDEVLKLLTDKKSHWPDEQLMSQLHVTTATNGDKQNGGDGGNDDGDDDGSNSMKKHVKLFSSNFVEIPEKLYGTRTHSLILVDKDGNGEYIEVNMEEQASSSSTHHQLQHYQHHHHHQQQQQDSWKHTTIHFKLSS